MGSRPGSMKREAHQTAVGTPVNPSLLLAVALSAALLSVYATTPAAPAVYASNELLLPLLAAVAAASGGFAAWLGAAALRRRHRVDATLRWIHDLHVAPHAVVARHQVLRRERTRGDSLLVRTLRAQVRTLEEALETEDDRAAVATLPLVGVPVADPVDFRRYVLTTLRAFGRSTADDAERRVLARVSAAVARLEQGDDFARPALAPALAPALSSRREPAASPALPEVAPVAQASPPAAYDAPPAPVDASTTQEDPEDRPDEAPPSETVLSEPAAPETPHVERVLPVPPLEEDEAPQPSRRWFRRFAA